MDEPTPKRRPSIPQLSKTPSWVMLGFILGALFVWALPQRGPPTRTIVVAREAEPRPAAEPPQIPTIEAVFSAWSSYAVWDNDTTQVAMWNSAIGDFAECYEVRRVEGNFYFRTLPHLTNRVIRHGKKPPTECPLIFTETDEQYRQWHEQDRFERPAENLRPTLAVPRSSPMPPVSTVQKPEPMAPPPPAPIEKGGGVVPAK